MKDLKFQTQFRFVKLILIPSLWTFLDKDFILSYLLSSSKKKKKKMLVILDIQESYYSLPKYITPISLNINFHNLNALYYNMQLLQYNGVKSGRKWFDM